MNPVCDYHIHTPLCGHAVGQPDEYTAKAIEVGLEEIGFSDHAPLLTHDAPDLTMHMGQLSEYHKMIEDARERCRDKLVVKVGIEADFIPGYEEQTKALLEKYPYDYVIGSIHFIKEWGFDNPAEKQDWQYKDVDQVYHDYYDLLQQSAECGLFDILGHVDLVKKFGHRPQENLKEEIETTAEVLKEVGVVVEINTAGLRKPVKEIYPALNVLKIYNKFGVPITFGSDAHEPLEVGFAYPKAVELAKAAGYKEYVTFKQRSIDRTLALE